MEIKRGGVMSRLEEKKSQALSWWSYFNEEEQNKLICLLYNLNLADYVKMDEDGNIIDFID